MARLTRAEREAKKLQFQQAKAQEEALRKQLEQERADMSVFESGAEAAKDFAGNLAYGFGETFMVPTVLDIASENIEGGINVPFIGQTEDLSKEFGSDDWIDESLAGKLGYALGTGAGLLTGIGAVGKGLQVASKAAGAGRTAAAMGVKKGAKELSQELVDADAFKLVDTARDALQDGIKLHTKATKPFATATRGQIRRNPLGNQEILTSASRTLRKTLKDMGIQDKSIAPLIELTLKESGESFTKNFGSSITSKLLKGPLQNSPRLAQLAGDMGYEAVLLGIFETAVGELGELTAKSYGMTEEDYPGLFQSWYGRVMHGAMMGSVLAPIRYIPGGKAVQFGKSGMVADIKHMGRIFGNRFRNTSKLTDTQLQMSLKTMFEGAGSTPSFLANAVPEFTPALLKPGYKLSKTQREILEKSFKAIQSKTPHFLKKMSGEIARDGAESFWRASVGSLAMNGTAYKESWEQLGTDEYPWDKVLADHYIGMLYMKRGKVFKGKPQMKQFYDTMGENGTGVEISKFVKSMDVLGYNPEKLSAINGYAIKTENEIIQDIHNRKVEEASPPLAKNNSRVKENSIDVNEAVERMSVDSNLNTWHVHGINELSNLELRIRAEKDPVAKKALQAERDALKDKYVVASALEGDAIYGMTGQVTRPMTPQESLIYIDKLSSTEFNGQKLNSLNADEIIRAERERSVGSITEKIRNQSLEYIESSLLEIGFPMTKDALGTPIVHPTAINVLQSIATNAYINKAGGEKINKYIDASKALQEALQQAKDYGFIKIESGTGAVKDSGAIPKFEALDRFKTRYENSAEMMHQEFFADRTIENSKWRDTTPQFGNKESGFIDPYIMSSTPIWDAMHTWEMHQRNRTAYEIFSNKGNNNTVAYQEVIGELFNGFKKIHLEGDLLKGLEGAELREVEAIVARINRIKAMLDPVGSEGSQKVEPSLITGKLNDNLVKHLGTIAGKNILSSPEYFANFQEYVQRQHMTDLLGNVEITTGLRKSLVSALDSSNPISVRRGTAIELVEGQKLLEILNSAEGATSSKPGLNPIIEANIELIRQYETLVEGPLKKAMADGANNIRFNSDMMINTDIFSPNEIKQAIKEMVFKADMNSALDFQKLYQTTGSLGVEVTELVKDLSSNVDMTGKTNLELADSLSKLALRASNVQEMLNNLARNNDAIGLRDMMDSSTDLQKIVNRLKTDPKNPEVVKEYIDALDGFLIEQFEKRELKLNLEGIEELDSYIDTHLNNISTHDRSIRHPLGNTSLSDSQYANRWFSGDATPLENMKKNPVEMLRAIGVLDQKQQALVDYIQSEIKTGGSVPNFAEISRVLNLNPTTDYIDLFVAPIVESRKAIIEATWETSPSVVRDRMGSSPADAYRNFVTDTFFVLQSGLGQRKFPMATFNNGVLEVAEANISTWNRGVVRLEKRLGIQGLNNMFLAGTKFGTSRMLSTRLTPEMMTELVNMTESGVPVNIDPTRIINEGDKSHLETYGKLAVGTGKKGTGQFATITLDESSMIFIHQDAYKTIADSWSRANSENRIDLVTAIGGGSKAENRVNEYLKRELNAKIDSNGALDIAPNVDNIKTIALITRLLSAAPHRLKEVIESGISLEDTRSALKYIKLDSPRTGVVMDKQGAEFTKAYIERMLPANDVLRQPYEIFLKQVFDPNGEIKPQRVLTIRDEKGPGEAFFDTQRRGVNKLKDQLIKEQGYSEAEAASKAEEILKDYAPIAASIVNGSKFLSLPEMTSILMQKGARENWFVMEEGKVVGFNVAIKPIEHNSSIDSSTGAVTTYVGKTAYTYHPAVDAMMKKNGKYFADSVSFKSSVKENATWDPVEKAYKEKIFETNKEGLKDNWIEELGQDVSIRSDNSHIYELPRESIFIKSISGTHDATMSNAFSNFLSKDALSSIEAVTGSKKSVQDMLSRYNQMQQGPLGMRKVAQMLGGHNYEHGDNMMSLIGIEGIIQAGGIPSFEYMVPQLERQTTSEYLGRRNFTSTQNTNGAYNVMAPALDLSVGIREGGIQKRFGGSGISGSMGEKSIAGLFGGGNEGISLVFNTTKAFAKKYKLPGDKGGEDYIVSFDGTVMGNGIKENPAAKKALLQAYKEAVNSARNAPHVETLTDFVMHIDGKVAEGPLSSKDNIIDNKSARAQANIIGGGKDFNAINAAAIDLRTPMAGANDRVITKIEKVLNKKRGPVSEMNMMDVIDPQDADFDLDKSSSFFALPGEVLKEVYNLSGYMEPASDQFKKILDEVIATSEGDMMNYRTEMLNLASKRGAVIRSHSVSSFLYQMGSNIDPAMKIKPGIQKDPTLPFKYRGDIIDAYRIFKHYDKTTGDTYTINFKGGREYVDSIQFTKSLIKETVDIYKRSGKIDPQQIERMVYEDVKGMFQITRKGMGETPETLVSAAQLEGKSRKLFDTMINEVLDPIARIFNIANMTETMGDGSSRKMSMWEVNNAFQSAKRTIKFAGRNNIELETFTDNLLGYLGEGYTNSRSKGVSHSALIQGLIQIEKGLRKNFNTNYSFDSDLAGILHSKTAVSSENIDKAVKGILRDQNRYAELEFAAWEIGQIEDHMASLSAYGKRNTSRYESAKVKLENRKLLLQQASVDMTNEANVKNIKAQNGSGVKKNILMPTKQYRKSKGELIPIATYSPGETIFYRKGDVLAVNYKRLKVANDNVSMQRRAMHKAFARYVPGIETVDYNVIRDLTFKYKEAIATKGSMLVPDNPSSFNKYGIISATQLGILGEYIKKASNLAIKSGQSEAYIKQFLYSVLTPKALGETFDIVGYDQVTQSVKAQPSFEKNSNNERLVFSLLDKAIAGKASTILEPLFAKELHQMIVNEHKKALMLEVDPSLRGDAFRFSSSEKDPRRMSILPKRKELPQWALDPNLDKTAKDVLLSYLDGSYFMDPVELYRMTMKLYGNKLGEIPNPKEVTRVMNEIWKGQDRIKFDPEGRYFNSRSTLDRGNSFQFQKGKPEGAVNGLDNKFKLGDGC